MKSKGKKKEGNNNKKRANLSIVILFALFIAFSRFLHYRPGIEIGINSWNFLYSMIKLFPGAFIMIGLFEVWVDKSVIEKHLGENSGFKGYFWMILLASTTMTPFILSLPIAFTLRKKGARLQLVLAFITASSVCRIPMTIFEASYLGISFSLIRLLVSLPLVILFSEITGRLFKKERLPEL